MVLARAKQASGSAVFTPSVNRRLADASMRARYRSRREERIVEFTEINQTNIRPSRIGLGTWAIGGWMWGGADDEAAVATIHRALDAGITLIDTAPAYGQGHSEEVVGRALAGRRE